MLKNFIKGIKEALPAVGGIIGYSVAGPLGAGIGSGIGSLAAGKEADDAFRDALIGGAIGYGGQTYFGRDPSRNTLGLGSFFREGTIPGVSNIITPFGQRGAESSLAKMASLTAPKAKVGASTMSVDDFIAQRVAEAGSTDPAVLEYAKDEAIKDFYGQKNKFDVSDFFVNNAGFIIPAAVIAGATGAFDEKTETLDIPMIEAGSQGALPTGVATLINPIINPDGTVTYPVKDGGIMNAKEGDQVKYLTPYQEAIAQFNHEFERTKDLVMAGAVTMEERSQYLGELVEKIRTLDPFMPNTKKDGGIMTAKEGKSIRRKLTDEERDYMDDYLLNKMMEDMMNKLRDKQMKEEQFKPKFDMMGRPVLEAADGKMMDGSISNFQMNSPRRDLFLERDGPISDDRGSPDKDTVFAKLADGEFVVNADTVADIGYGMGATSLDQAKEMGGSFFYGLQDAQKKGILGNMVGRA